MAIENRRYRALHDQFEYNLSAMTELRIGTSAFTADGWVGSFYPAGTQPKDFLSYYATKFDAVEVDSTFYRIPSAQMVDGWYRKTPPNFKFALKATQVITHEKVLVDCDTDVNAFVNAAGQLEEKLGAILFQFGYFNKKAFPDQAAFLKRLQPFLKKLPKEFPYALEIRNKAWVDDRLLDLLREHNVAFALIDQSWMPRPWEFKAQPKSWITSDLLYVRWLGDRKGIEEMTETWDKTVVDRKPDLREWAKWLRELVLTKKVRQLFAFANNHYAGHGPATANYFQELWDSRERT